MALLTDNFHSPLIRAYYQDQRRLSFTFLQTIGAKALVLEEQKLHELPNYDGIHEEAELRYKMVNSERIRSIKRKLLEKEMIRVIKCGRNGKYRIIEIIIEHSKKNETSINWLSKYNYLKKFLVDKNTQINILQKPINQSIAQVLDISNFPCNVTTGSNYNWTSSSVQPSQKYALPENRSRNSTSIASSIPPNSSSTSLILEDPEHQYSPNSKLPPRHPRTTHRLDEKASEEQLLASSVRHEGEIVPIRLKNSVRVLDLFFFNRIEMEAFLMVLKRYSCVNISMLSHLFYHSALPN